MDDIVLALILLTLVSMFVLIVTLSIRLGRLEREQKRLTAMLMQRGVQTEQFKSHRTK